MYSQELLNRLFKSMIDYFQSDPKRIQHFVKVHSFAKLIGQCENLNEDTLFTLESAAYIHDIGIKNSELKYGSCSGKNQEKEGFSESRKLLTCLDFPDNVIERVSYIVAHHHTYNNINSIELQILIESDFLVNLYEDSADISSVKSAYDKIFKTNTGKEICRIMFGI